MKKIIPIFAVIFILGSGGAFFTGVKVGQASKVKNEKTGINSQDRTVATQERMRQMQARGMNDPRMMRGGAMVSGEITAKDDKSLTVKTISGSSKIIFYSPATKVSRMADVAAGELNVGQSVWANGAPSQDGSLMAQSIQLVDNSQTQPVVEEKK